MLGFGRGETSPVPSAESAVHSSNPPSTRGPDGTMPRYPTVRVPGCGEGELEHGEPAPREDARHEGIFRDEEGPCGWADGEIARVCLPVPRGRVDRRDDRPGSVREPLRLGLDPGPARRRGRGGSLNPAVPIP